MSNAEKMQSDYYTQTANTYERLHTAVDEEHENALAFLAAIIKQRGYCSVLDVGSGTGRALRHLKQLPGVTIRGVEPVAALREVAYANGVTHDELLEGDALRLPFENAAFDLVCAFGVLHHIKDHSRAVAEMCRVARCGVFISDANNFGQGSSLARRMKQAIRAFGLWPLFDLLRTRGKGYHYSEGDGVFYSYSIFDDATVIRTRFPDLYWMSTRPSGPDLFRSAEHVALFATGAPAEKRGDCR